MAFTFNSNEILLGSLNNVFINFTKVKNKILLGWLLPPKLLMLGESFSISWYILCGYKIRFRFMVLNATFNNISVLSGSQFYWWTKPEYREKTIDLSKTDFIT